MAAAIAIAVAVLVLLGWTFDLTVLRSASPDLPAMRPNTALALIAAGLGVLALRAGMPVRRQRIGRALGYLVATFGVVVVCEYLFGAVGIDEVLFTDSGAAPGRPSAHAAVGLLLVGLALATLDVRPPRHVLGQTVLLAGAAAVLAALIGYAYEVQYLRATSDVTGMSILTAVVLAVLVVGIAYLRPERGLLGFLRGDDPAAVMARWLGLAAIGVPFVLGFLRVEAGDAGLLELHEGVAVFALSMVAVLLAIVAVTSLHVRRGAAEKSRAERHFATLFDDAPDAMVIVDDAGKIRLVNEQLEGVFGYERGALVGERVEVLLPDRLREGHVRHRAGFARNPHRRRMGAGLDLVARRRDGSEFPVEVSLGPLEEGDVATVSAAIRDVTERRRAEAALREAEERFRRAFEDSATGMALVSVARKGGGRFIEVNDALCDITGYSASELMAMRIWDLLHPDEIPRAAARSDELASGAIASYHGEHRLLGAGGVVRWAALSVSLVRDVDGEPLHAVIQVNDVTERKRFEGQLQYLADHDPLTGLFNRRRFEDELKRELVAARRYASGGAVVIIDLDNFKYVNDTLGHATGDQALTATARTLRGRLRASDILARLGGDEFGVILPHARREHALTVAESLCEAVRSKALVPDAEAPTLMTASAGVTLYDYAETGEIDELTSEDVIVEADIAMYEAKDTGRDRALVYDRELDRRSRMEARLSWVQRIREALGEERFTLHAQPILALCDDPRPRHELLIRMVEESGDLIPPGTFLYIAERFDLIQGIDRWVIRSAIRLLAAEQRRGNDVVFEINLSAKSLVDPSLIELIKRELTAHGTDGAGLVFEVTETEAIVNIDQARAFAQQLQSLGCGFAIDDFGAGFASFYYLKHLQFDFLKIDGEFIENLPASRTDQLVVRAVVEIAQGLGKRTIAEFVGDEATVRLLRGLGVDYAQGFHISRPAPIESVDLEEPASATAPRAR